jgi:hypothetical protein
MLIKFKLMFIFCVILGFAGCSSLDVAVSNKINSQKRFEKVVVFPFQIEGAKCGSEFADAVSHQFVKSGKFDVMEREALDKLIEEEKLSLSGLIDETKAAAIGKKLGVDVIILGRGTAEQMKEYHCIKSFSLRMISVETGSLLVTIRMAEGKNPKYDDLARDMVSEIMIAINKVEKKYEAQVQEKPKEAESKPKETENKPNEPVKADTQEPEKTK